MEPLSPTGQILTTARLRLSPVTSADETLLHDILSQPAVLTFTWNNISPDRDLSRSLREESERTFRSHGWGMWCIALHDDDRAGFAGLRFVGRTERIELMFVLGEEHWGKGIAGEAVSEIIRCAFTDCSIDLIEASTHPGNVRSRNMLKRIGMTPSGEEDTPVGRLIVHTITRSAFASSFGTGSSA